VIALCLWSKGNILVL